MSAPYCYDYPRPALTVDLVAFAGEGPRPRVLLIRRKHEPFAGRWALPGGFVEIDEPVGNAVRREFVEETGVDLHPDVPLAFLGVWSAPGRDPRGRTISLVHAVRLDGPPPAPRAGDDAGEAAWRDSESGGELAFDHALILAAALRWLADGTRPDRVY